ncbi:CmpA/NrtA family ABC transporter substrate-binding protein [uncultured Aureimonas sp.]|uniref:CmpA/NrtA family ABC transporter substrate-binding protein n=1 Tax=uncultured Aureimonas sp. TaxID=1604662 RepID=UPI0025FD5DC4|nr:CmpA/NrtA family ABC transporter substrate-binding protein [uncultured Aureimonas sp.]
MPASRNSGLNRRRFLLGTAATAGTAALFSAIGASFPGGAFAQGAGPETTKAVLGFIALTDAAPLIIAKEKGLFAKHGMPDVEVVKQSSWGTTRDNLVLGSAGSGIDGAHILTPMPYLMSAGTITQGAPLPMQILARLNLDGQGISVATGLRKENVGLDAGVLRDAFAAKKAAGTVSKVAVTFPGGTHDLWMRYWLAAAGIDPNSDVETIVVPPPQMVANLKVNTMDAFCVGEPWHEQMVNQDVGYSAITTGELWSKHPEKSFAMRADWVAANPKAAKALTMAVLEAQQWCDAMENKDELASIVSKRAWFNVPTKDIANRLKGTYDYGNGKPVVENSPHIMKFWRDHASYPFQSHDLWFLTEDQRWGYLPAGLDKAALIAAVNREDIWRTAAKDLGVAEADIPASTSRGVETFFDGKTFDPANPDAYLASLSIKRIA